MKHFNFAIGTWTAPAWMTLILSTLGAALATYLMNVPPEGIIAGLTTAAGFTALWHGALVAVLVAVVNLAKTMLTPADAKAKAALAAAAVKTLSCLCMLGALALMCAILSGCLSALPVVPVTPQNQAQVTACETDEAVHNISVIAGTGLAGIAAAEGTIATQVTNQNTVKALGWSVLIEGAVAAVAASVAGVEAANYAQSACPSLLGVLPVKPAPTTLIWHLDPPRDASAHALHWEIDPPALPVYPPPAPEQAVAR
jgi:hypothetical protein